MTTFDELLTADSRLEERVEEYRAVLRELANSINANFGPTLQAQAVINPDGLGVSYPHLGLVVEAPDAGLSQTLLHYRVLPNGTIEPLTSEPRTPLASPGEFRAELQSIVAANLRFTLRRLEQDAKAPFEATLRTQEPNMLAANDTKVRLSRAGLERLAAREEGSLDVTVFEAKPQCALSRYSTGLFPVILGG